jgi:hypothetical protein
MLSDIMLGDVMLDVGAPFVIQVDHKQLRKTLYALAKKKQYQKITYIKYFNLLDGIMSAEFVNHPSFIVCKKCPRQSNV